VCAGVGQEEEWRDIVAAAAAALGRSLMRPPAEYAVVLEFGTILLTFIFSNKDSAYRFAVGTYMLACCAWQRACPQFPDCGQEQGEQLGPALSLGQHSAQMSQRPAWPRLRPPVAQSKSPACVGRRPPAQKSGDIEASPIHVCGDPI